MKIPGYRIEKRIGQGGMAAVYLAIQESLERPLALKVLGAVHSDDPRYARRFVDEGRIIAALRHKNIITIHDVGVADGLLYISMEYVEGGDLKDRMGSPLPPQQVLGLVRTLGAALAFAHRAGVAHRDVKPANILFRRDGTVLLTDFGIAKRLETEVTVGDTVLGTPGYLSPEQARGEKVDGRADIYSLGVVLYELLIGRRPYEADTPIDTILKQLQDPIPELPAPLARYQPLLNRMIARDPDDRFPDMEALLVEIDALSAREAHDGKRRGGRRLVAAGIAATLLVAALVAALRPGSVDDAARLGADLRARYGDDAAALGDALGSGIGDVVASVGSSLRAAFDVAVDKVGSALSATFADARDPIPPSPRGTAGQARPDARATADANSGAGVGRPAASRPVADAEPEREPEDEPKAKRERGPRPDPVLARVERLNAQGREALAQDRLTIPSGDSAVDHFRQALELDPDNGQALQGLAAVASRYADLAESDLARHDFAGAKQRAEQGLGVRPGDRRLKALSRRATQTMARVEKLLAEADDALSEHRLTTPAGDNALHYYEAVLKLDPGNARAANGKARIVRRYAQLAEDKIERYQYADARELIRRGLEVRPGDRTLLALRSRAQLKKAPTQLLNDIKGLFD